MRVSFADAMIYWEMDGFISFASEVGKEKNSGLQRSIQIFILLPLKAWKRTIQELDREQVPVYFTIDLDCLDPSVFPGTGTPEAGGVSFLELLAAIRKVSELNIVGADVNELAPMLDPSGVSTATACKVVRELLLAVAK